MVGSCAHQSIYLTRAATNTLLDRCVKNFRRLLAVSREVLHHLAPLAISHEVLDHCFGASSTKSARNTSMKKCSVKLSPNFSPITVTVFENAAWRRSRLSRTRVRCHTHSTVLLLRWCPVPRVAATAIANLFSIFLPTFLILRCLDPFIYCLLQSCAYLIFGSFGSEEVIGFHLPIFSLVFPQLCMFCISC